jgi:2-C-methyl-D-erythritol 2,4-cyclodiphosphate synthase
MRVGIGYDIHRFSNGRALVLGGVRIPFPKGLKGHSDADVVLHAVCDALLGAAGLGDIGEHFPDTDARFKGVASIELLKKVRALITRNNFTIRNVDAMLVLERPKIAPYKERMRAAIARALGIRVSQVGIQATTHEGVGPVGRNEACMCWATAALVEKNASRRA